MLSEKKELNGQTLCTHTERENVSSIESVQYPIFTDRENFSFNQNFHRFWIYHRETIENE